MDREREANAPEPRDVREVVDSHGMLRATVEIEKCVRKKVFGAVLQVEHGVVE